MNEETKRTTQKQVLEALLDTNRDQEAFLSQLLDEAYETNRLLRAILSRTKALDRKYEVAVKVGAGIMRLSDVDSALERIDQKLRQEEQQETAEGQAGQP